MSTTPSIDGLPDGGEQALHGGHGGVEPVVLDPSVHDLHHALALLGDPGSWVTMTIVSPARVHLVEDAQDLPGRSCCPGCRWARRPG
jgi:hypothetical protein